MPAQALPTPAKTLPAYKDSKRGMGMYDIFNPFKSDYYCPEDIVKSHSLPLYLRKCEKQLKEETEKKIGMTFVLD